MKVVVFGGSGFLGSYVADALSQARYEVTIFDIKKSPYLQKGQNMVVGDILDEGKVSEAVKQARYVYNFSGISDIDESREKPLETMKLNVIGSAIIFNACARENVERIFIASSMYVCGNHGSFYRVSKQTSELLAEAFYEKNGLKYTILRYGSLYGPRSQSWNGIKKCITQALLEGRIDYPGTGDENREYIHVSDAARLSVEIIKPAFENQTIVITGTQKLTSKELVNMIKTVLAKDIKINFLGKNSNSHYTVSPYTFSPKVARKLTPNLFVDIGEGLVQVASEIYAQDNKISQVVAD